MFENKKCVKLLLTLLLAIFSTTSALAERTLTLEKAIEIALENNKSIQSSKLNLDMAKSKITQARSGFLPRIDFNGSYTWWEKAQKIDMPAGAFGSAPISMELDFTKDYIATFSLTQPLFTSGRIWQSYKMAKLGLDVAREEYRKEGQSVIFSTKKSFYDLLLAQEFVKVTQEALSLAGEHLRITKLRFDAGEASEFDVLRAEVEVANLKPQLIRANNRVKLATLALKNTLGIDLEEEVRIEGEFGEDISYQDLERCLKTALENRPEIAQLIYQKKIASKSIKLAWANRLPTLSAIVNYQWLSQELFNNKEWENTYSGFLVLSIPLFDGFYTRGKVREAKVILESLNVGERQLEDGIKLEVRQTYLELVESSEIIKSSQESVKQAQKNIEIAQEQFAGGQVTSLDVMSTQLALTTAKTNYFQALHDYVVAIAKLDKATGTIK